MSAKVVKFILREKFLDYSQKWLAMNRRLTKYCVIAYEPSSFYPLPQFISVSEVEASNNAGELGTSNAGFVNVNLSNEVHGVSSGLGTSAGTANDRPILPPRPRNNDGNKDESKTMTTSIIKI